MDPHSILQRIPAVAGRTFTVTPLAGGMTNRNYRVDVHTEASPRSIEASYVLRIAGAATAHLGIDRKVEMDCSLVAARLGLGPEIVAALPEHGAMLRVFVPGSSLTPEDIRRTAVLDRVAKIIRRYHDEPLGAGRFCPFATIRSYHSQAAARGLSFPNSMATALESLARIEAEAPRNEPLVPCHNDLLAANIIESPDGLRIIDWEYAGLGDRFFDLGNLAVNNAFGPEEDTALLESYFGQAKAKDRRRLHQMRLVSDLRESLWGFLQAALVAPDPGSAKSSHESSENGAVEVDYADYGRRHLQRFLDILS